MENISFNECNQFFTGKLILEYNKLSKANKSYYFIITDLREIDRGYYIFNAYCLTMKASNNFLLYDVEVEQLMKTGKCENETVLYEIL